MLYLLVKNETEDLDRWLGYFYDDLPAAEAHGLTLERVWRDDDEPDVAYFCMRASTREGAEAFMARPESEEMGRLSGVTGGWARFLTELPASR